MAAPGETKEQDGARYVLITECLQNDFLLNPECRLSLPEDVVRGLLLGKRNFAKGADVSHLPLKAVEEGPLGLFLEQTIGRRSARGGAGRGVLDVINIRDWHGPGASYDDERRRYGTHCEAGSWGAEYVDGLKRWLDPAGSPVDEKAKDWSGGSVRVHHVHADSIYDFRPRGDDVADADGDGRKYGPSALENLLDRVVRGTATPVYVAVIGFYTDIKVQMLLTALRNRYVLPNLAVSDTFTGSVTLERHLAALDFDNRILAVEVIHGINDLVRYLGGPGDLTDEPDVVYADSFASYEGYVQDRQNVLGYESEKLKQYEILTQRRSIDVYNTILRANKFLTLFGMSFLAATLVLAVVAAFDKSVQWNLVAITGGLGFAQTVGAFFTKPTKDMEKNLSNLAVFKMILESHSLKAAVARFHLTTPEALHEMDSPELQIKVLQQELKAIDAIDRADFAALSQLGFGVDDPIVPSAAASPAAAPAKGAAPGAGHGTIQALVDLAAPVAGLVESVLPPGGVKPAAAPTVPPTVPPSPAQPPPVPAAPPPEKSPSAA